MTSEVTRIQFTIGAVLTLWFEFLFWGQKCTLFNNIVLNDNSDKSSWHFVASLLLQKYITQLKTDEY